MRKSVLAPVGSFFCTKKNGVLNVDGDSTTSMTPLSSHALSLASIVVRWDCGNGYWRRNVTLPCSVGMRTSASGSEQKLVREIAAFSASSGAIACTTVSRKAWNSEDPSSSLKSDETSGVGESAT